MRRVLDGPRWVLLALPAVGLVVSALVRHIGTDPLLLKQNPRVEVFLLDEVTDDLIGSHEERTTRIAPEPAEAKN